MVLQVQSIMRFNIYFFHFIFIKAVKRYDLDPTISPRAEIINKTIVKNNLKEIRFFFNYVTLATHVISSKLLNAIVWIEKNDMYNL